MKTLESQAIPMLRWIFHRADAAITCQIEATTDHDFEVCIVPHWDVSASTIERFDAVHRAFERHAQVSHHLQNAGWRRAHAASMAA